MEFTKLDSTEKSTKPQAGWNIDNSAARDYKVLLDIITTILERSVV